MVAPREKLETSVVRVAFDKGMDVSVDAAQNVEVRGFPRIANAYWRDDGALEKVPSRETVLAWSATNLLEVPSPTAIVVPDQNTGKYAIVGGALHSAVLQDGTLTVRKQVSPNKAPYLRTTMRPLYSSLGVVVASDSALAVSNSVTYVVAACSLATYDPTNAVWQHRLIVEVRTLGENRIVAWKDYGVYSDTSNPSWIAPVKCYNYNAANTTLSNTVGVVWVEATNASGGEQLHHTNASISSGGVSFGSDSTLYSDVKQVGASRTEALGDSIMDASRGQFVAYVRTTNQIRVLRLSGATTAESHDFTPTAAYSVVTTCETPGAAVWGLLFRDTVSSCVVKRFTSGSIAGGPDWTSSAVGLGTDIFTLAYNDYNTVGDEARYVLFLTLTSSSQYFLQMYSVTYAAGTSGTPGGIARYPVVGKLVTKAFPHPVRSATGTVAYAACAGVTLGRTSQPNQPSGGWWFPNGDSFDASTNIQETNNLVRFATDTLAPNAQASLDIVHRGHLPNVNVDDAEENAYASVLTYGSIIDVDGDDRNVATNSALVSLDAAQLNCKPLSKAVLNNRTYVAAGSLSLPITAGFAEVGFYWYPLISQAVNQGSGSTYTGAVSYIAVLEGYDEHGLLHRSTPSAPWAHTGNGNDVLVSILLHGAGGKIRERLAVTLYRTKVSGSTHYEVTKRTMDTVDPTVYSLNITDSLSDAQLSDSALLYTTGGYLPADPPPPTNFVWTSGRRLWCIDSSKPTSLWYSKESTNDSRAPEFHSVLSTLVPSEAVGGAAVGDKNLVFTRDGVYYFYGNGPDNTGAGSFVGPHKILGAPPCTTPGSIVATRVGVFYQSNHQIYAVTPDLGVTEAGKPVRGIIPTQTSNARIYRRLMAVDFPHLNTVRFFDDAGNEGLYNYQLDRWSIAATGAAYRIYDVAKLENDVLFLARDISDNDTTILRETYHSGTIDSSLTMNIELPWLSFESMGGFQRIRKVTVVGEVAANSSITLALKYNDRQDSSALATQSKTYTVNKEDAGWDRSPFFFSIKPTLQKCRSIQVTISSASQVLNLKEVRFEVALKSGSTKLAEPAAT